MSIALELHQNNINKMQVAQTENTKMLAFSDENIDSLILPIRTDAERLEKHSTLLENFKNELKGGI